MPPTPMGGAPRQLAGAPATLRAGFLLCGASTASTKTPVCFRKRLGILINPDSYPDPDPHLELAATGPAPDQHPSPEHSAGVPSEQGSNHRLSFQVPVPSLTWLLLSRRAGAGRAAQSLSCCLPRAPSPHTGPETAPDKECMKRTCSHKAQGHSPPPPPPFALPGQVIQAGPEKDMGRAGNVTVFTGGGAGGLFPTSSLAPTFPGALSRRLGSSRAPTQRGSPPTLPQDSSPEAWHGPSRHRPIPAQGGDAKVAALMPASCALARLPLLPDRGCLRAGLALHHHRTHGDPSTGRPSQAFADTTALYQTFRITCSAHRPTCKNEDPQTSRNVQEHIHLLSHTQDTHTHRPPLPLALVRTSAPSGVSMPVLTLPLQPEGLFFLVKVLFKSDTSLL